MQSLRSNFVALLLAASAALTACSSTPEKPSEQPPKNVTDVARSGATPSPEGTPKETEGMAATTACYKVDAGKKAVLQSQTFAIDFEPFKNSCFVTSHDPEFKDPPLESEIAIYKDGKRVFSFPEQFNGVQVGCWVEAVAFQDLNEDRLTDVIVVGKCGTKSGSYNENNVYINTGKTFVTRQDANSQLADLKTIREIAAYVKENPQAFLPKS
jgi:hypothetical protein